MSTLARRLRAGWQSLRRGGARAGKIAGNVEVLDAVDAYRRWSRTYGAEDNELQRLEAELRDTLLPGLEGCRVLDVGAGTGRVSASLRAAGAEVVAADLVFEMLRPAPGAEPGSRRAPHHAPPNGRACVADAVALPFRPHSFDVVVSALTLGHVAALDRALEAIVGVLRPGGSIVITDFHPAATRRGWLRSFRCGGETLAVRQHVHTREKYERGLVARGCTVLAWEERCWGGMEVVFGLRARHSAVRQ